MVETVGSAADLEETWQRFAADVEDRLQTYLDLDADCPETLRQAMSYSLMAGGKRLRPVLVLLSCEACGGDSTAALPAACAIEMVHTYSLIHDDLPAMDDDELRRGRATNHVVYGEAQAILAGDGLLTLALEILARDVQPPTVAAACCADLARAAGATGMVGGQVADLHAEQNGIERLEDLEAVHRRKTGRLLCAALSLGARIAAAKPAMREALQQYGQRIGLAFQIVDDLLDSTGDEDKLGKSVHKDAEAGKLTYPGLLGVAESRRKADQLSQEACEAVSVFGRRGRRLQALARFIVERDH